MKAQKEIAKIIQDHSDIDPKKPLPASGPERTIEEELIKLKKFFEALQSQALAEAKSILGDSFDNENRTALNDLIANVGPALGTLDTGNLRRLPSAHRLGKLASLSLEELSQAEAVIQKLVAEANEIAKLEEQPDVAARLRLYAKVASWIRDLPEHAYDIKDCPVCQSAIDGKPDAVTGRAISEHIREYLEIDSNYLEKTLKAWEENAKAILSKSLPDSLRAEMTKDLPARPTDLISSALGEELFESEYLSGCLMPLKSTTQTLCKKELESLQAFVEPEKIILPEHLEENEGSLAQAIGRVIRADAFARWRQNNEKECIEAFTKIVGKAKPSDDSARTPESHIDSWSLSERLVALDRMVKSTEPLTAALSKVKMMTEKLTERRKKEDRLALYSRTRDAIEELLSLDDLVERQVAFLIHKLLTATLKWRDAFYVPAFADAPKVIDTDVGTDGSLIIDAAAEGTKASAHHISNASDLRATLLSFLIAFWQHLQEVRGGLSLLLLDDLQELFDRENRRRVANTVPSIVESGGRVIVTTNDISFGRRVTASAAETIGLDKVDRRRIHPLNASRQHIELGQSQEAIDAKRRAFEHPDNRNEAQPARDYIKDLRIYLENRLIDFLDIIDSGLPAYPTFSDLMSAIRGRITKGHDAFATPVFAKLISYPALADNSDFLKLMNQSHHGNEDEITFNAVWQVKEQCIQARKLIDSAHEEYERWLRRDPREPILSMPVSPAPMTPPSIDVPVIVDLAAFTTDTSATEVAEAEERFSGGYFENRALYLINTHNFGFAATPNSRAIVDLRDRPIVDRMLVIAIHRDKVYARRLFRDDSKPKVVVLSSEAENPLKRPPSVLLPTEEVRLLNVVGILFDDRPRFPRSSEEAELLNHFDIAENIQIVFRVRGDSAIPLALPGQIILGGSLVMTSQLDELEGSPVAIATSEGSAFKKIGKPIPGAQHVRQFGSIGGLGESMLVRTENLEDSFSDLPLLHSIRRVLGVLYETN
jgi:tetratricopeptide (TPR) repeat protein